MTKSLRRHYSRFGERLTEEMGLQTILKTGIDDADVTFCGRVFHSRTATCEVTFIIIGGHFNRFIYLRTCITHYSVSLFAALLLSRLLPPQFSVML